MILSGFGEAATNRTHVRQGPPRLGVAAADAGDLRSSDRGKSVGAKARKATICGSQPSGPFRSLLVFFGFI